MKKMLNKKGFMFIETIVTLTVLMVVLLMVYTVFTNLLEKEKTITAYDKKGYVYSLHYVRYYLQEKGFLLQLKNNVYLNGNSYSTDKASLKQYVMYAKKDEAFEGVNREAYYTTLMDELKERFGLVRLEFVDGNQNGFNKNNRSDDDMYSSELENYATNMVPGNSNAPAGVIKMIAEFYDEKTDKYYYSWVFTPKIEISEGS